MQVDAMNVRCVVQPVWRCSAIWSTWPLGFVGITSWRESKPSRWRRCFFGCSVAAGFIDSQYVLSFFPPEFRNASGLGVGSQKIHAAWFEKRADPKRKTLKAQKETTQWCRAWSQVQWMTWCRRRPYPSNTEYKQRGKKKLIKNDSYFPPLEEMCQL